MTSTIELPVLEANGVNVWTVAIENHSEFAQYLTADETVMFGNIKIAEHQQRMRNTRGLLRFLLGHYLQMSPAKIQFEKGQYGKPFYQHKSHLCFNVSHSKQYATVAINYQNDIGVDIEAIRPLENITTLAQRIFSESEQAYLFSLSADTQLSGFYKLWTRKEAVIKTNGEGLHATLATISTTDLNGNIINPIVYLKNDHLQLTDISAPSEFCTALVYPKNKILFQQIILDTP
jgi:4'-phosphopantetheinyl transferase